MVENFAFILDASTAAEEELWRLWSRKLRSQSGISHFEGTCVYDAVVKFGEFRKQASDNGLVPRRSQRKP